MFGYFISTWKDPEDKNRQTEIVASNLLIAGLTKKKHSENEEIRKCFAWSKMRHISRNGKKRDRTKNYFYCKQYGHKADYCLCKKIWKKLEKNIKKGRTRNNTVSVLRLLGKQGMLKRRTGRLTINRQLVVKRRW